MHLRSPVGTRQPNNVTSRGAASKDTPAVGYFGCLRGECRRTLRKFRWASFPTNVTRVYYEQIHGKEGSFREITGSGLTELTDEVIVQMPTC